MTIWALTLTYLFSSSAWAEGFFWNTKTKSKITQAEFFDQLQPKSVLVFGEKHAVDRGDSLQDSIAHHRRQGDLIRAYGIYLKDKHEGLNGAFEFIPYTDQWAVELYFRGHMSKEKMLATIGWSPKQPFEQYERQFTFPLYFQGWTYGINAPKELTKKVAQEGLPGLNEDERALLPPNFQLGNSLYFERFTEVMGGHVPAEALERYFAAQSIWDDTMAWKALEILDSSSNRLIIWVGEFHVEYGGGLPDRLKARSTDHPVHTLLQREYSSENEIHFEDFYHEKYGALADYIWVTIKE